MKLTVTKLKFDIIVIVICLIIGIIAIIIGKKLSKSSKVTKINIISQILIIGSYIFQKSYWYYKYYHKAYDEIIMLSNMKLLLFDFIVLICTLISLNMSVKDENDTSKESNGNIPIITFILILIENIIIFSMTSFF